MNTLFPLTLTLVVVSCSAPSPVNIHPEPQDATLVANGEETFSYYKSRWNQINNAQVARVGARLQKVISLPNADWEFVTFGFSTPNAFALPGGKVGVNQGILPIAKNDAGLATIIAHEIAHVTKNHHLDRKRRKQALSIVQNLKKSGELTEVETVKNNLLSQIPTNTEIEIEADQVGLIYMAKAGYDPEEAIKFWQRFVDYKQKKGLSKTTFLATHPLDSKRLAKLHEILPYAKKVYNRHR